jgi:thioredoxin-related protein
MVDNQKNKYFIVICMSAQCSHCVAFKKNHLDNLKTEIAKTPHLQLIIIDLPTMQSKLPSKYHDSLRKYISWFPTIALFPEDTWSSSMVSGTPLTGGAIFNGAIDGNGNVSYVPGGRPMNVDSILEWVESEISSGNVQSMKARFVFNQQMQNNQVQTEILIPTSICSRNYFKPRK